MVANYTFFRPLLAADRAWSAIDWHCAAGSVGDGLALANCFVESGAAPLANVLPFVITVSGEFVQQADIVKRFDPGHIVFVLPAKSLENASVLTRCKELRNDGNRLAIAADTPNMLRKVPVAAFDYLWLDAAFARQELTAVDFIHTDDAGFSKIATGVKTHEMFRWLCEKGFDWNDSRFITTRDPQLPREPDLTRLKLLKLLNLVKNDGDTRAIEDIFREEPKLSYNLLRLVNSVAVGARTKISNFSQAIAILGRRQLQRWLQLLIYANNLSEGSAPNPLMQIAAARGRQLELLCGALKNAAPDAAFCDNAFMTGLFSLLDILINLPISDILKELPLRDEVVEALITPGHGGPISHLLAAVVAGENGDYAAAEAAFASLGISPEAHAKAQVAALYWATRINVESDN